MTDPLGAYRGIRTLVTGSGGFIGLWVSRLLTQAGADVVATVRRESSVELLKSFGVKAKIRVADLLAENSVESLIYSERPSVVFNLAGYGIDRTETEETVAFRLNADLVTRLAAAMNKIGTDDWRTVRLVHAGSAMEYGAVKGIIEEGSDTRPTTVYGRSKLAGTMALMTVCKQTGLKAVTGRLFAVYGPGEAPARLLPTLIGAASGESEIELTEGLHERDFTFVADAAEGLLRLGLSDAEPGSVVNIATGKLTSIKEFTETAAKIIGIGAERLAFGALPTRPEEMFNEGISTRRCEELLEWVPPTTIAKGVRRTITMRTEDL